MTIQRRFFLALTLAVWLVPPAWAQPDDPAANVAGAPFARRIQFAGAELLLNGTGFRAVAFFKAYAAGLYLTVPASSAEAVVKTPGPKRLRLRMLTDVSASEFEKALRVGMPRNSDPALVPRLADRMDRLAAIIAALGTVHKEDIVDLDFDPARGLLFSLNGKLRGEAIAGDDFYAALLLVFVGAHPSDEKLKAGLLGRAS